MFSSFFRPEKEKTSLAVDIGTEAVKVIAFEKKDGKVILLGRSLQYLDPFGVWDHGGSFESGTLQKYVGQAIKEAQTMAGREAKKAALALPPYILRARVQTVSVERERHHAHISDKEEKSLLRKISEDAKALIARDVAQDCDAAPPDVFFSGIKIVAITIDGYRVSSLHHFNGKKLEFTCLAFFSISAQSKKTKFDAALSGLAKQLKMPARSLHAFHPAHYLNLFAQYLQDGIYVDIGGKCTQVFLLQNHRLCYASEFGTGATPFSDIIMKDMGFSRETARSFLEQYAAQSLSPEVASRIKQKFAPLARDWFSEFKNNLRRGTETFSPSIFIFGGGSLVPEIKEALDDGEWDDLVFVGSPRTTVLYPKDLPRRPEDSKNCASSPQDVAPVFLCYAQNS